MLFSSDRRTASQVIRWLEKIERKPSIRTLPHGMGLSISARGGLYNLFWPPIRPMNLRLTQQQCWPLLLVFHSGAMSTRMTETLSIPSHSQGYTDSENSSYAVSSLSATSQESNLPRSGQNKYQQLPTVSHTSRGIVQPCDCHTSPRMGQ